MKGELQLDIIGSRLIEELNRIAPTKQVGRTFFQKLMYLLSLRIGLELYYDYYHYGPYSSVVAELLELLEQNGIVQSSWDPTKGYSLKADLPTQPSLEDNLEKEIKELASRYKDFSAKELSIIATAFFLKQTHNIQEDNIAKMIQQLKPKISLDEIKRVLDQENACLIEQ